MRGPDRLAARSSPFRADGVAGTVRQPGSGLACRCYCCSAGGGDSGGVAGLANVVVVPESDSVVCVELCGAGVGVGSAGFLHPASSKVVASAAAKMRCERAFI